MQNVPYKALGPHHSNSKNKSIYILKKEPCTLWVTSSALGILGSTARGIKCLEEENTTLDPKPGLSSQQSQGVLHPRTY